MKIGDLFIALGIKADQQALKRFDEGIRNIKRQISLMTVAMIGAAYAINRFVDGTTQGVVSLQNLNNQTGLSIDKLQKLQQVGQLADLTLTPEAISQSLANLQKNIIDITKLGKGNFRPFQLLGIDPRSGDAFEILDQLRDRIKGLDPSIASNLIQELGLSPQFINILRLSREEFEKLSQNTFLDPNQRNLILQVGTNFKKISLQLKILKDQILAKLAPLLLKVTKGFFEWILKNGSKLKSAISFVADAIIRLTVAIVRITSVMGSIFIDPFVRVIENLTGINDAIKYVTGALGLLAFAFMPFSRIIGIVTLLIFILEDLAVWFRGGDSLFREWANSLMSWFGKAIDYVGNLFDSAWEKITVFFDKVKTLFINMANFIKDILVEPFQKIGNFFNGGVFDKLGSFIFDPSNKAALSNNSSNTSNTFNIENNINVETMQDMDEVTSGAIITRSQLLGGSI